jgi:murein DD-endopeptidase MepM/ murein hydrolase activator NlpD
MFHLISKKISQYLIVTAFSVFTLVVQTQFEQQEIVSKATIEVDGETERLAKNNKKKSLSKTIYIGNFPVKTGYITSHYGMRKDPFTGKRRMHRGIDIAAKKGTSIYPVGEGKVISSGRKAGFGRMIEIEHSSTVVSRYSHLKKSLVKVGQMVKAVDIIAQVGNTGRSTGPHLHLEIAFNGETANPRTYLSREVASNK